MSKVIINLPMATFAVLNSKTYRDQTVPVAMRVELQRLLDKGYSMMGNAYKVNGLYRVNMIKGKHTMITMHDGKTLKTNLRLLPEAGESFTQRKVIEVKHPLDPTKPCNKVRTVSKPKATQKGSEKPSKARSHYDIILAWAGGADVEVSADNKVWLPAPSPTFAPNHYYRIKAKPTKEQLRMKLLEDRKAKLLARQKKLDEELRELQKFCI